MASALTQWRLHLPMLALATAPFVGYLVLVRRARAGGHRRPLWRTTVFTLLGVGALVVATTSFLAVYRTVLFWPATTANTVLLAFGDGLVDALPGMVVALSGAVVAGGWYVTRTPSWWRPGAAYDQLLGGELMVGVAEAVGVPLIIAACIAWSRADTVRAAAVDAELDARERAAVLSATVVSPEAVSSGPVLDAAGHPLPEGLVRPRWTEDRP